MKAEPSAQLDLLSLQALDLKLAQLAHRRANVPEIAVLAAINRAGAALRDRQVAVDTAIYDLTREQNKAEADVEQVRTRMSRDRMLLESGSVGSARQLEDLQREVGSLGRRIEALEDAELEVMERLEAAQAKSEALTSEAAQISTDRMAAQATIDAAFADVSAEEARVGRERDRVVTSIPADLLKLYDRIRAGQGGIGAAQLQWGRCQGCQMTLSPATLGGFRVAPADEVLRCEECMRILVRTDESGL